MLTNRPTSTTPVILVEWNETVKQVRKTRLEMKDKRKTDAHFYGGKQSVRVFHLLFWERRVDHEVA